MLNIRPTEPEPLGAVAALFGIRNDGLRRANDEFADPTTVRLRREPKDPGVVIPQCLKCF